MTRLTDRVSDASVRERTGRGWDEWFTLLDGEGPAARDHTAIARWLVDAQGLDNWSTQTVTVGYEQARGLREPGQDRDGTYTANTTRTIGVPVGRVFAAFADARLRRRWLPQRVAVRSATADKYFRADWGDGTRIDVGFAAKGSGRAQVAVAHQRIVSAEVAAEVKAAWTERLLALKKLLEG